MIKNIHKFSKCTLIVNLLFFSFFVHNVEAGQFTVLYENDALSFNDKDRYYTNGMEISYLTESEAEFSFGHQIFTPANLKNLPLEHDRPDVGYTYLSYSQHTIIYPYDFVQLSAAEFTLGFVGFDDLSREMQNVAHDVFDDTKQFAYGSQIKNEITFMATFSYGMSLNKNIISENPKTWNWDFQPRTHLSVGTPYTRVGGGAEFRLGRNLPVSTYLPIIRPGNGIKMPMANDNKNSLSFYVFGGVDGYACIWDTFIDGNITGKNSPEVDMRVLVAEITAGLVLSYQDFTLTYAHAIKTKEFETQDGPHSRGSLSLSYRF